MFRLKPGLVYDEAVYLSQIVRPRHPIWGPHRAWGTVVLVSPVAVFGVHVAALRLYLAVVSSALLAWAYWLWDDVIGPPALGAAMVFAVSWVALYFGTQAFPNMPLALFSVATVGLTLRAVRGRPRAIFAAGVCIGACALIRPSDATALFAGVALALLMVHRTRCARVVGALAAGLAAGWLPWVIESFIVFGGPFHRFRIAALENAGGALRNNLGAYVRSFGGPLLNRVPKSGVPVWASALPLAIIVLALVACARFARDRRIDGVLACVFAAIAMASTYLFFSGATAPRFLLPSFALLAIPASALFFDVVERLLGNRKTVAVLVLVVLLAPLFSWEAARAHTIWRDQVAATADTVVLARAVSTAAAGVSCAVAGPFGTAEISLLSHCRAWDRACPQELAEMRKRRLFIEGIAPASRNWEAAFSSWTPIRTLDVGGEHWRLYELRPADRFVHPSDAPPCTK